MPVDLSRIVFLDISQLNAKLRVHDLFDNFNLNEVDLIVWNTALVAKYAPRGLQGGLVSTEEWEGFVNTYSRRIDQIIKWVKDGCVLIVFPTVPPRLHYAGNDRKVV